MMLEASFTGLLRTIFIILGVFVLLRFIGRILKAKNEQANFQRLQKEKEDIERAKQNIGKIKISKSNNSTTADDVEFEEV